jgi:hypothetical protein
MTATRASGTYNDAYADNVKLTLDSMPPEADTTAPMLLLSGRRVQRLGRFVRVRALCSSEPCRVIATGALRIRRKHGKASRRRLALRGTSADLVLGRVGTLRLRVPRKTRRAAASALAGGGKVQANLTVTATDAAGNKTVVKRNVALRRSRAK